MFTFSSGFFTSKTTWTAVLAILSAAIAYVEGNLNGQLTVGGILTAMLIAFLKDGMGKVVDAIEGLGLEVVPMPVTEEDEG